MWKTRRATGTWRVRRWACRGSAARRRTATTGCCPVLGAVLASVSRGRRAAPERSRAFESEPERVTRSPRGDELALPVESRPRAGRRLFSYPAC